MNSYKNGKQYLEGIRFSIPTDDFFSVVDSCHFNYFEDFCPVLVQLDKKKAEAEKGKTEKEYQLQIWKRGGIRVFERSIKVSEKLKPFANWNVFNEVVLFQEADLKSIYYVKLLQDENAQLYRFDLKTSAHKLNNAESDTPSAEKMPTDDDLKPGRMIGYTNGFIFMIYGRRIYYFNADELIASSGKYKDYEEIALTVPDDKIFFTAVQDEYFPVQLMATEPSKMVLVVSGKTDSLATFLGIVKVNENKIKFQKMGIP